MADLNDFSGGWNTDAGKGMLSPNELRIADNLVLSPRGGCEKRPGTTAINSAPYAGHVEQIFEWIRNDGSAVVLAVIQAAGVYTLARIDEDGSKTDLCQTAGLIRWFGFQDRFYFLDGNDYRFYDGTGVYSVQLSAAPTAPTLSGGAIGGWYGQYQGVVVFVDKFGVESAPSPASNLLTIAGKAFIYWTNIALGPPGTVKRRLYRTPSYADYYRLAAEIGNNTQTTYIDRVRDNRLKGDLAADVDLAPIKKCRYCVYHEKSMRFFFGGDGTPAVYFTEPNGPALYKPINVLFPKSDMGILVGLKVFADVVLASYEKGNMYYAGIDPTVDAVWEELGVTQSPPADRAVTKILNRLCYPSGGGLYALSPSAIGKPKSLESDDAENLAANRVGKALGAVTAPKAMAAAYEQKRHRNYLAYADEGERNNKVLVLDEEISAFTRYTGLTVNDILARANGEVWLAGENYILKLDPAALHDVRPDGSHAPIVFDMATDEMHLGLPKQAKIVHHIFVTFVNPHQPGYQLRVRAAADGKTFLDKLYTPKGTDDLIHAKFRCYARGVMVEVRVTNDQLDMPTRIESIAVEFTPIPRSYRGEV